MRVPTQTKDEENEDYDDTDNDELDDENEPETRSASTLPRENGSGSSGFKDNRSNRTPPALIGRHDLNCVSEY